VDEARGGHAGALQRSAQLAEERRRELLALEHGQKRAHHLELVGALGEARVQPLDRLAGRSRQQRHRQEQPQARRYVPGQEQHRGRRADQAEEEGGHARASREGPGRGLGPGQEAPLLHLSLDVGPRHRQRLTQIQPRRQLGQRLLARHHRGGGRRRLQPVGQLLLADRGARHRQQREHRALAEQIQVGGVGVAVVAEALAVVGRGAVGPGAVDAGKAALVEAHRACGLLACPHGPAARRQRHQQQGAGRQQPAAGEALSVAGGPGHTQPHHQQHRHDPGHQQRPASPASTRAWRSARRRAYSARGSGLGFSLMAA
jgi:hypothetical protein